MPGLLFVWDPKKAAANLRKHGIAFKDGLTLFDDEDELMLQDPDHRFEEERLISIGRASSGKIMVAFYTQMDRVVRLISLRPASLIEIETYQQRGDDDARRV